MRPALHLGPGAALLAAVVLSACGGGGGGSSSTPPPPPPVANVQGVVVSAGPTGQFPNMMTTSVTICVPGTSTCNTIQNVQVDTGSTGLRLLASAVSIALPALASPSGGAYAECMAYADGVVWGPLATADVKLAGETASAMSVQLIQDNGVGPPIAPSCSAQGAPEDSVDQLGANGVLGIGLFLQDCGAYCTSATAAMYFDCSGSTCSDVAMPLALQVSNPVGFFAEDNNGVILQLPAVVPEGAASVDGNLIFGIGTQANNVVGGTVIGVPDAGTTAGEFTAIYNGVALPNSFIDSGSTGLFFDDPGIVQCAAGGTAADFYCPGSAAALSELTISVALSGNNGGSATVSAMVANAEYLFAQPSADTLGAFGNLAGPAGAALPGTFDFGIPFFFGRSVFTAFEQRSTPVGDGPYFAFQSYP